MRWLTTAIAASSVKSNRSHALNLGLSLFSLSGFWGSQAGNSAKLVKFGHIIVGARQL
jgi:hypothetical protein